KLFNNKYIDYLLKFTTADYGGTQMGCKESDEIEKMKKEVEVYNKKIEEKEKLYSIFNGNDLIDLFPSFKGTKNMGIYLKFAHDYIKERNFKVTKKDVKDYIISIKESNESISYKDYKNFCDKIDNYMVGINPLGDRKEIIDFFKKFPDHDKNFYRIYFDLKVDRDDWKIEIPKEIKDFMGWYRFPIVDYEKGLTKDKYGRVVKFSKIFKQMGQDNLIKTYADSKTDTLKDTNDLQVVISRHIYDIIGSSTNRGWTTCIDLYDKRYQGRHLKELIYLIGNGVIIAYLIRKKDRNIENPISRCFIKKVNNELRVDSVYGTNVKEFTKFLDEWVKKYNSYISKK
ncbi:MAG: hypothetical protein KDH96_11655, partial [Candidatus Riesia sp.]|nr:hypothetical protein [Candidatus Riesia sp.]